MWPGDASVAFAPRWAARAIEQTLAEAVKTELVLLTSVAEIHDVRRFIFEAFGGEQRGGTILRGVIDKVCSVALLTAWKLRYLERPTEFEQSLNLAAPGNPMVALISRRLARLGAAPPGLDVVARAERLFQFPEPNAKPPRVKRCAPSTAAE
jgi:hypothetical protein